MENEGDVNVVNGQQQEIMVEEEEGPTEDELRVFMTDHMSILLKLIGKKRSAVRSAVSKLMKKTKLPP